jgi:ribosomal protein S18 acetylase RimI-like enzyme
MADTLASVRIRKARLGDARAVAALVYETSPALHDRFAGDRKRALVVLEAAFERDGTNASAEVVHVAEVGDEVAAAMSCFAVGELRRRNDALLRLALSRTAPWRWPALLLFSRHGRHSAPSPPSNSLYIDALASESRYRRRGAARALLAAAEREATELGLSALSLSSVDSNWPARMLYESAGFAARSQSTPQGGFPGFVLYVKEPLERRTDTALTRRAP